MGQYYIAVVVSGTGSILGFYRPWGFGEGAKLLEHSHEGSNLVQGICRVLVAGPQRIVWAGDYADPEPNDMPNLYDQCQDLEPGMGPDTVPSVSEDVPIHSYTLLVNHDLNMFVRLDGAGSDLHPLPILTAEGNGRGGGDLYASHPWFPHTGTWSRCLLSLQLEAPEGFTELVLP